MLYIACRNHHNVPAWENPSHTCCGPLRKSVQLKLLCSGSTCTPDSGTFSRYCLLVKAKQPPSLTSSWSPCVSKSYRALDRYHFLPEQWIWNNHASSRRSLAGFIWAGSTFNGCDSLSEKAWMVICSHRQQLWRHSGPKDHPICRLTQFLWAAAAVCPTLPIPADPHSFWLLMACASPLIYQCMALAKNTLARLPICF